MTTITELKKLLFSMILKTPIWLVHLAANQSSVMSIPISRTIFYPSINLMFSDLSQFLLLHIIRAGIIYIYIQSISHFQPYNTLPRSVFF